MRHLLVTMLLAIASGTTGCGRGGAAAGLSEAGLPCAALTIKGRRLAVELAVNDRDRVKGYRFRARVPEGTGMLFVYPVAVFPRFVMSNVTVPLSIAFIDDEGRIRQICDMQPMAEQTTVGAFKVRYALEVPQGWFARNGIAEGEALEGLADIVRRFPPS
ncbi:MAG TPA: DUF192 domain-containing protein [Planctomycetota bacterium]|jgi:uncharacterized membrane protein (UPF0127 family)|nr:DUF192 domain-containing protein [Planctomycetota bacterium]OQC19990.1 MAG: hypothetical protein BWX69_02266 [Planctomycetes bacterium ADurb.Bin069]NMD36652.1 DUF192 domain-containing protein [Planctomycetota bacterium]HNR99536.1 DUF192 domain-containing protein [Planctomycetota bacterium]HNU26555.1 DUF192 domain-containing protein [Planctomycetota bacterium]